MNGQQLDVTTSQTQQASHGNPPQWCVLLREIDLAAPTLSLATWLMLILAAVESACLFGATLAALAVFFVRRRMHRSATGSPALSKILQTLDCYWLLKRHLDADANVLPDWIAERHLAI